jgi:glycosyltransferase involved in cell wall biosynthesis
LALLFAVFCVLAPIAMLLYAARQRRWFSEVIFTESRLPLRGTAYAHFCHRAYLTNRCKTGERWSISAQARLMNHRLHALCEPWVYGRAERVVVPSRGLSRELAREYPSVSQKLMVISNPVDVDWFRRPENTNEWGVRAGLAIPKDAVVFVFVALGDFKRKGLHLAIEALARGGGEPWWLLVVGGRVGAFREYQSLAAARGVQGRVVFAGFQRDVRPYFWESDAFLFPSEYEVFPLVCLQAAAAGVPLVCTAVYGAEEFMVDGATGFLVQRELESIRVGMARCAALARGERRQLGEGARAAVQRYGVSEFAAAWEGLLGKSRRS